MTGAVVLPVFCHLINKEQGENLYASGKKLAFPLNMGENCLPDLDAPDLLLADIAGHISRVDFQAVEKLQGVVPSVDLFHHKPVLVFVQQAGVFVEAVPLFHRRRFFPDAGAPLAVKLDGGRRHILGEVDALQIYEPGRRLCAGSGNSLHRDFLHQMLVVSLHGVQAVYQIVNAVLSVGGGVAKGHQRMKFLQTFLGLPALYRLRFVDNQNRIGTGNDVDGAAGAKFVHPQVNPPGVLPTGVEGLGVDDHHADGTAGGEAFHLRETAGVVDEKLNFFAVILREMLLRDLKGLVDALPYGDAGNHHDELAPPVVLVQFKHGFDIGIGLAHAGFHLNGQIVPPLQSGGGFNLISPLNLVQMFQDYRVAQLRYHRFIAPAGKVHLIDDPLLGAIRIRCIHGG